VRSIILAVALAASLAMSGTALADAGLKFPSEHAACVAQAWVPANTDPESEPGDLGAFIRDFAQTGEWGQEIRQQGCKP
jgi:hypothetical protein